MIMSSLTKRFWSKVITSDINSYEGTPCLEWIAYLDRDGYGRFSLNGKRQGAHRVSYEDVNGTIPEGLVINHKCRNRCCVNADHLEVMTNGKNIRIGLVGFVRGLKQRLKTHCKQGHEFNEENTYIYPNGFRQCRACHRIQGRQSYHRKKSSCNPLE